MSERGDGRVVEWAVSRRPCPGQTAIGDNALVQPTGQGFLVVVVDGLGHGPAAADAARTAIDTADRHVEDPVTVIATLCHEALRGTRGAALSVGTVSVAEHSVTWLGIGTVAGTMSHGIPALSGGRMSLPLLDGIVGQRLPVLAPTTAQVGRGDVLLVTTDGVDPELVESLPLVGPASAIADRLIDGSTRDDDALAVVFRYLGARR